MIIWTGYLKYRAELRGFDLAEIERILRCGEERYLDAITGRMIAIGRHGGLLVMIPYDMMGNDRAGDHTCDHKAAGEFSAQVREAPPWVSLT